MFGIESILVGGFAVVIGLAMSIARSNHDVRRLPIHRLD